MPEALVLKYGIRLPAVDVTTVLHASGTVGMDSYALSSAICLEGAADSYVEGYIGAFESHYLRRSAWVSVKGEWHDSGGDDASAPHIGIPFSVEYLRETTRGCSGALPFLCAERLRSPGSFQLHPSLSFVDSRWRKAVTDSITQWPSIQSEIESYAAAHLTRSSART